MSRVCFEGWTNILFFFDMSGPGFLNLNVWVWLCFLIDTLFTVLIHYMYMYFALLGLFSVHPTFLHETVGWLCEMAACFWVFLLLKINNQAQPKWHKVMQYCICITFEQSKNPDILGNLEIPVRNTREKEDVWSPYFCTTAHLIGNRTQLHCPPSRPGQLLGQGMMNQRKTMSNAAGVKQQSI